MTPELEWKLKGIKKRLFKALRSGALGHEHLGFMQGFGRAMKSCDHRRPSQIQIDIATRLDAEIRHMPEDEPVSLIDWDDTDAGREMAINRAEF